MTQTTAQTHTTTHTIEVPGATLAYDVAQRPSSTHRPLMLIGQPMGASGFTELMSHFDDRTRHHLRPAWRRTQRER